MTVNPVDCWADGAPIPKSPSGFTTCPLATVDSGNKTTPPLVDPGPTPRDCGVLNPSPGPTSPPPPGPKMLVRKKKKDRAGPAPTALHPILIPPPPPPHPPSLTISPKPSPKKKKERNSNPDPREAPISIPPPSSMTAGGATERHTGPPVAPAVRKPAPSQPWSHLETVHLIEAYEEKWYSLKRGQLKAQQWEEVAAAVAARCGFDGLSKNGTQCRHKIEKLRKRYRAERLRPASSAWPYFERMDRMERGPLPISVRPPPSTATAAAAGDPSSEEEDEEEEEEEEEEERTASNTRSIHGILREGFWGFSRVSRNPRSRKRRAFEEEEEEEDDDDKEEEEEGVGGRGEALSQLAAVVRRFGEGLVRMEKRRMEMLREVERDWMEMEAKRAEMVMESQRCLVDTIADAFSSLKKAKSSQDL